MTRQLFKGLNGANPLGFLAAVGLLRTITRVSPGARLGFTDDGAFHAWLETDGPIEVSQVVAEDAAREAGSQPWRLSYDKQEKAGVKQVFDLKAPPAAFSRFLGAAIDRWVAGDPVQADYAAAFGTDVARDGNGNTKPTAFHFTAANQQFLDAVEKSRERVTAEWVALSLATPGATQPGPNLRWDPDAERSRALMGVNPTSEGTVVNAPLEWLAFRALPLYPCVPIGKRVVTTGVTGRRQDELRFHWPLWAVGADIATVHSVVLSATGWVDALTSTTALQERRERGVIALCSSDIRRSAQGFGNFGPAAVSG